MAKRSKRVVKQRARAHQKLVRAGRKMRKRRTARGVTPASVRKKRRTRRRK